MDALKKKAFIDGILVKFSIPGMNKLKKNHIENLISNLKNIK